MGRACILAFLSSILCVVVVVLLPPCLVGAEEGRLDRVPFVEPVPDVTDYFGLYHEGEKVGWGMLELKREARAGGVPRYVSRTIFRAEVRTASLRGSLDFETIDVFGGVPPYDLLHAWERKDDGHTASIVEVVFEDGDYHVTKTENGDVEETRFPFSYTLVDRLTQVYWVRQRPAVGARVVVSELDITEGRPAVYTYDVLAHRRESFGALHFDAFDLRMSDRVRGRLGEALIDAEGRVLIAPIAGRIEMRLEPEAQARDLQLASELGRFGRVPVVGALGERRETSRVVLGAFGRDVKTFPSSPRIQVTWLPDLLETRIEASRPTGDGRAASALEVEAAGRAIAADVDRMSEGQVRRLLALARRAVGDAETPREKVRGLLACLGATLRPAFTPDEPSVGQLLLDPAGDATEHARLFVALAGAEGLIARPVTGLIYVGDPVAGFETAGFEVHAWCEVLLDGRWVEVDPTLGLARVTATHLPLACPSEDSVAIARRSRHWQFEVRETE